MDSHVEKVYVILGNDLQDGFKTLDWALRKWKPNPFSIVILHVTCNISKDFVYTPFGKLPANSVSEEKLLVLRKYEQEKIEKLISKYISFCGKVKAEILKVEKSDEPIHKVIVDLISRLKITKLVMGLTFMKSSSWKSKNAISGSFYIHQHKPNFCEFFIICGGKLVLLRGESEEAIMEDDQGVNVAKREICEEENEILQAGPLEAVVQDPTDSTMVEELEAKIREEVTTQIEIKKSLDNEKEQIQEIMSDIAENENRLNSLLELKSELSNKLQLSTLARSHGEAQLEKAVLARAEMVREIEELRQQRDVLQRRIEFCKEKDAIGMVTKHNEITCGYREYTAEDIRLATDGFSESLRLNPMVIGPMYIEDVFIIQLLQSKSSILRQDSPRKIF
ncbi:hypothetical protein GH714_042324 [Hevea brasiliensis]|uniref:RING-type E3 ubiquitin transferase n=1 Tax=Hevea brasiliensis TaxID=3981 RepID=A0A6A6K907_HEVBR|nr:hypothetical protein GH714_042324 [Hevea brasiliensis]